MLLHSGDRKLQEFMQNVAIEKEKKGLSINSKKERYGCPQK